jgi:predicted secreted protein
VSRILLGLALASFLALFPTCALTACGGHAAPAPLSSYGGGVDDTEAGANSQSGIFLSAPGQTSLTVSEKPKPGYRWRVTLPAGVGLVSSIHGYPSTIAERKNTRTFTFSIAQPGMYVVKGAYVHHGRAKPARSFTFSIYGNPPSWPAPAQVFTTLRNGLGTDVGSVFAIALKENPTTGYAWVMRFGSGLTLLHELTVTPGSSSTRLVSAEDQHLWLFRVGKTSTTVTGSYVRPSAPSAPAARFSLKITILPPGT